MISFVAAPFPFANRGVDLIVLPFSTSASSFPICFVVMPQPKPSLPVGPVRRRKAVLNSAIVGILAACLTVDIIAPKEKVQKAEYIPDVTNITYFLNTCIVSPSCNT